jgi:hypothetical protein
MDGNPGIEKVRQIEPESEELVAANERRARAQDAGDFAEKFVLELR